MCAKPGSGTRSTANGTSQAIVFLELILINVDMNDISVIQGDSTVITRQNFFDLNGRSVQFTPQGTGYTITSSTGGFDAALGTKTQSHRAARSESQAGYRPGR